MATASTQRATLDDLAREPGKSELIGGRIVQLMASGFKPGRVAGRIYRSLDDYAAAAGQGFVLPGEVVYAVPELPSGRESFSPNVAYYIGPLPGNLMRFVSGPPTLAVEVRSENDYGKSAEREMAEKRADYFAAGTLVVWDVDPVADRVDVYKATDPNQPARYVRGQTAEAEPAVPGWSLAVDAIFKNV